MKEPRQNDKRRDFLRDSSLMLASAIPVGLAVTAQALAGAPTTVQPSVCRLGLVGCGKRGVRAAMDALSASPGCRVVALADAFGDRLQQSHRALKGRFPTQFEVLDDHRFSGPNAAESLCQTEVDAVILAAPPRMLPEMVETAVQAGKHVFVEMPVAVDVSGVQRFLAAGDLARQQGTVLMVGLQRRSSGDYRQTLSQVGEGAIGTPLHGRVHCNIPVRPVGERSRQQSLIEHKLRNWRAYEDFSGGPIVEELTHNLDVFNWIIGEHPWGAEQLPGNTSDPSSTAARIRKGEGDSRPRLQQERGEVHAFEFHYRDGFRLTCTLDTGHTTYSSSEWLFGSRGACDITQGRIYDLNDRLVWRTDASRDGFAARMREFLDAVASGASIDDSSIAGDCTLAALLGRSAMATASRCRWAEL